MDFFQLITAIVTNGIGAVCAAAVLWLAWYRETKTIPAMLATFARLQEKALEASTLLAREERATCQKWHEENRGALGAILEEIRENKHYLRDLANLLTLRKAVEDEQAKKQAARHTRQEPQS